MRIMTVRANRFPAFLMAGHDSQILGQMTLIAQLRLRLPEKMYVLALVRIMTERTVTDDDLAMQVAVSSMIVRMARIT